MLISLLAILMWIKKKHFFYWYFGSRRDINNDPIVLWLSGGPGASSLPEIFTGVGPQVMHKNGKYKRKCIFME